MIDGTVVDEACLPRQDVTQLDGSGDMIAGGGFSENEDLTDTNGLVVMLEPATAPPPDMGPRLEVSKEITSMPNDSRERRPPTAPNRRAHQGS